MIGGGFMGKAHAMAYAAMPMFFWPSPAIPSRKVIVDVSDELAEDGRRRYGFAESSSDWQAVIARSDIDIVDNCAEYLRYTVNDQPRYVSFRAHNNEPAGRGISYCRHLKTGMNPTSKTLNFSIRQFRRN